MRKKTLAAVALALWGALAVAGCSGRVTTPLPTAAPTPSPTPTQEQPAAGFNPFAFPDDPFKLPEGEVTISIETETEIIPSATHSTEAPFFKYSFLLVNDKNNLYDLTPIGTSSIDRLPIGFYAAIYATIKKSEGLVAVLETNSVINSHTLDFYVEGKKFQAYMPKVGPGKWEFLIAEDGSTFLGNSKIRMVNNNLSVTPLNVGLSGSYSIDTVIHPNNLARLAPGHVQLPTTDDPCDMSYITSHLDATHLAVPTTCIVRLYSLNFSG